MQHFHTHTYSPFMSNWTKYFMRGTVSSKNSQLSGGLSSWETITGWGWLHFHGTGGFGSWRNSLFFLKSWKKNLSLKCWESCDPMDQHQKLSGAVHFQVMEHWAQQDGRWPQVRRETTGGDGWKSRVLAWECRCHMLEWALSSKEFSLTKFSGWELQQYRKK